MFLFSTSFESLGVAQNRNFINGNSTGDRGVEKELTNLLHSASAFHLRNIFLGFYFWLMFFCVFFSNAENYGEGAKIKLDSNLLPYLDAAVFQSIVNGFKENQFSTAFISVANSKKTIEILLVHE